MALFGHYVRASAGKDCIALRRPWVRSGARRICYTLLNLGLHPSPMLRKIALLAFVVLPLAVFAQQPPRLEPIPVPPPPPMGAEPDASETPVRITPGANEQIEEIVIDGKRIVRVTTPGGAVYYLRDDLGESQGGRRDSLDRGIRVPLWVIHEF